MGQNTQENSFGSLLRLYREKTFDRQNLKFLSRDRFGREVGKKLGRASISHDIVYKWEKNLTPIGYQERPLAIAILKVLVEFHGLMTLAEANALFSANHDFPLDEDEVKEVNPQWLNEFRSQERKDPPHFPVAYRDDQFQFISHRFEERSSDYNIDPPSQEEDQ